ncbi:MAG: GNAT family N-acetyltransferase [Clostridia bacterium]|nr:GNAT family N-acetyltransferase [Clostridia bacterium]
MKSTTRNYSNEIDNFSANSLYERTKVSVPASQTIITQSSGNEILRIIHSASRTFVSVQQNHIQTIQEYLRTNDILEKLCLPSFYCEILDLLGYDPYEFLLEPSEEFLQNIKYNCVHMLDYVCIKDSFNPQFTDQVEKICRGDERFILDDGFDDTMYCITANRRMVSCSYYKTNNGRFENTCSMQVFSRPQFRGKGYAKITASAATQAIVQKNKLALWACQVENIPSRKIAESLGYKLIGGELRIVR